MGRIALTMFWFLVAVAIFSRLMTTKEMPELIRNGTTAMRKLYNGAFGY